MKRMKGQEAMFEQIHNARDAYKKAREIADAELFTVNVDKAGLGKKR